MEINVANICIKELYKKGLWQQSFSYEEINGTFVVDPFFGKFKGSIKPKAVYFPFVVKHKGTSIFIKHVNTFTHNL